MELSSGVAVDDFYAQLLQRRRAEFTCQDEGAVVATCDLVHYTALGFQALYKFGVVLCVLVAVAQLALLAGPEGVHLPRPQQGHAVLPAA
eukprot:CAMPEP_0113946012 /NCGR_PEP_ID=MMETSP1339-20121228/53731_1 /TAXON_ID=94617 /ORGANISM="Fibrocapsa japonica" /LENGTH=89 /DNA_ID=CAMNT_0000951889 /DNA_START=112 /DNA_END=377 /DNA_ORIENTATION=+ /assembly_acc=CAM_ASM_000762